MKNDLGVDHNEWFDNPPKPDQITDEYAPCDVEYDNTPSELIETPTSMEPYASRFKSTPDHEKTAEEVLEAVLEYYKSKGMLITTQFKDSTKSKIMEFEAYQEGFLTHHAREL